MKNLKILETEHWIINLSKDQSYLGRCKITLKENNGELSTLSEKQWLDFKTVVTKLESALKKSFGATMFNWTCLMNNAYKEKSPKPHVHWHFRPRYKSEVKFEGVTFTDSDFAKHYDRARKTDASEEIKNKIIEKIKDNLE